MEFATVGLGTLLPKLAELLKGEYDLQTSTKKGIQFLCEELERTQAALSEVGEVPLEHLSELVRLWARDVREVSYDMEDIADTFMVRVQGPSKSSAKEFIKKVFFNPEELIAKVKIRREVTKEIKEIKERVTEVAERLNRYKQIDLITRPDRTRVDPRIGALYTKVNELVGIGAAKAEVIKRLTKGDAAHQQKRIVVSIAGFGGLGKTTLAKAVYDEIQEDFDCTAFVSVSRNPDAKKVLKHMLYELDKKRHHADAIANLDDIKLLIDLAHGILKNKRYLIVIDDIWDKEPWEKVIGLALIDNNMRSRIMTTTRNIDVAEHIGGCYRLKPLSDENSETLFYGRIFGSKDECPRHFFDVSRKILKKCGGVPLAIVTTSGLLSKKTENTKAWYDICESIGSGLSSTDPDMGNNMREILLLSYYDLPSHLRTCLLYLSIFPEDYVIGKDGLIWRWVAEGFVQSRERQSFLETGESYFNELINRSLIQPAYINREGTPWACRVHDTVLDLIVSLSKEECFITGGDDVMKSKVRRLSLHTSTTTWATMEMPKLRSLTIFEPSGGVIDSMPSLSHYLLLRVLDIRDFFLKDLTSLGFVGRLSHLRYLGLSSKSRSFKHDPKRYAPDKLPVEIGRLQFLQTLDLKGTAVEELPSSVTGLGQLMCLRGPFDLDADLPSDGLKKLTSLEVLESVTITSKCNAEELGLLTKLRVLDVMVRLNPRSTYNNDEEEWRVVGEALVESVGKLNKVESLCFRGERYNRLHVDGSIGEPLHNLRRLCIENGRLLPTWIRPKSLPILSYLEIDVYHERNEDIKVLGMLPSLRHLRFRVSHSRRFDSSEALERCEVGPDAFPCAELCEFSVLDGALLPCMFPRGAMPKLRDLTFSFNIEREQYRSHGESTIDNLGLAHLPSLQRVRVFGLEDYMRNFYADLFTRVEQKLKHEAAVHPNHPRLELPNHVRYSWRIERLFFRERGVRLR